MKRMALALATVATTVAAATPVVAQTFGQAALVDGDQIFVGEPGYDQRTGVVYVFERAEDGSWVRSQRLEPADREVQNRFGIALAKQDDVLLVSATRADAGTGAVYVFRDADGTWTESGRLEVENRSPADSLGSGLAIDGDWIAIGSIADNGARGAAYTFRREGETWVQHSKLTPDQLLPEDRFGVRIALDGNQMLVSASSAGGGRGAVYAFAWNEETQTWNEQGQLQAPQMGAQAAIGTGIALRGDMALIGAPGSGYTLVYGLDEDGWQLRTLLTPFETQGANGFGSSIAFDGTTALIGANSARFGNGRVFAFDYDAANAAWTSAAQVASGEPGQGLFGSTVALDGDLAVGAAINADEAAGSAWIVARNESGWTASDRITGDLLGYDAITGDEIRCSDDGMAGSFECESVDLLSFIPLGDMEAARGTTTNDVWGWNDPETGREIVLVGMSNQTTFVDVTNPANPVYLGRLPLTEGAMASVWRDMKVYQNHMYVVADNAGEHGMQIFDLTRLRELDGSDPPTFEADGYYDRIHSAHNIVVNEETGFAYSVGSSGGGETCGGGLHMIDVRDPANPTFAGCFQDVTTGRQRTGYSHDAQCVVYRGPDEDYQGREICMGSNETALSIADVTDKANPVAIAMATYPNVAYSHQGWFSEDQRYFYMGDELDETGGNVTSTRTLIWDLEDLDDPVLAAEYMAETLSTDHNLYILGNTMYQSNYKSGLRVLDISDPENPVPVGHFDTMPYGGDDAEMQGSWSNYPYFESGVIAVTSRKEGLFLVRYRPRAVSQ